MKIIDKKKSFSGFTIIEMVVVVVLVSIMAVVVISRLTSPNAFEISAAQTAIVSQIRGAQQAALGREDISFKMLPNGSDWDLIVEEGTSTIRSTTIAGGNLTLETGSTISSADSCATAFDTAVMSDFEITFDGLGNAADLINDSTTESVDNGVRICVNDTVALSICVSPAGFAYEGDCDV